VIIHPSPMPDVVIPDMPITEYVLRMADQVPDRPALIDGPTGRTYTYGQLKGLIHSFAGGLAARGLGRGDTIALMAPNIPEFAIVFHGAAVAGVAVSTVNPTYTADEVRFQLNDSRSTLLITIGLFAETAREAIEGTAVDEIVIIGDALEGTTPVTALFGAPIEQVPIDAAEDVVVLPYSSGTTGCPQGRDAHPPQPRRQPRPGADSILAIEDDDGRAGRPAVLPHLRHAGAHEHRLAGGATIITMPRFDLEQFLSSCTRSTAHHRFVRGAADRRGARQAPDRRPVRPCTCAQPGLLRRGAPLSAELAQEAAARSTARWCRATA
jgi:hypothetical protein